MISKYEIFLKFSSFLPWFVCLRWYLGPSLTTSCRLSVYLCVWTERITDWKLASWATPTSKGQHRVVEEQDSELSLAHVCGLSVSHSPSANRGQECLTDRAVVRVIGNEIQKVLEHHFACQGCLRALPLRWLDSWVPPHAQRCPWASLTTERGQAYQSS